MRTILICLTGLVIACEGGQTEHEPRAQEPVFTLPEAGSILWEPQIVSVAGDGIQRVEFRLDDRLVSDDGTAPFEWTLTPESASPGLHTIAARAAIGNRHELRRVRVTLVPTSRHPTLSKVRPRVGSLEGGTPVTLTGTNFLPGATVTVNGVAADAVEVSSESVITCNTPPGDALARVEVTVGTSVGSVTRARAFRYRARVPGGGRFPLSVHSSGRYLVQADGTPFLIHGDSPWSVAIQLTESQIVTYLEDRMSRGFNAILFNGFESYYSSQEPPYLNANGDPPFGSMSPIDFDDPEEAYWSHIDFLVDEAEARGIACMMLPAYLGYGGGKEGWHATIENTPDADLERFGEFLARRYTQGNVIWGMGGDFAPPDVTKQWHVVKGIRNIRAGDIITAHGARVGEEAYRYWSGQEGFNLNNIYSDGQEYDLAAIAYTRTPPIPFFLIEGYYDGERANNADCRRQAYASILSGACGHLFGNNPIYGFGDPKSTDGDGPVAALSSSLSTTATLQMAHVKGLFEACEWWRLEPRTDTSLVTSYLGSGEDRICPALANDGSFAMIWSRNSGSVTVGLSALKPSRVRARFYDTTDGSYSTVTDSPFSNTGTQSIDWPGERVLVLDGGE